MGEVLHRIEEARDALVCHSSNDQIIRFNDFSLECFVRELFEKVR